MQAPTLLVVGGNDAPGIEVNEQALARLHVEKQIAFIPGATHLFEEAGALEEVAHLARAWFTRYLHRTAGCPRPSHLVVPGAPDDV